MEPLNLEIETGVAFVTEEDVFIRGYRQTQICGNLSYTQTLFLALRGRLPTPAETKVLDGVLTGMIAYEEWAVTAIVASLKREEPWSAFVASFMQAGRYAIFPQHSAEFILHHYEEMKKANLSIEEMAARVAEKYIRERKNIPGFGHGLYKKVDPRAQAVRKVAENNGLIGEKTLLYEAIHAEFTKEPRFADMCINIDGRFACTLLDLDFRPAETSIMAVLSLTPGVLAQIIERQESKMLWYHVCGFPQKYTGSPERELPPEYIKTPCPVKAQGELKRGCFDPNLTPPRI